MALKSDGTVLAWGANDYGQLGDCTTTDRLSPVNVSVSGCPALYYSAEPGYGTAGVLPATGTASTVLAYKVVYTQSANIAPNLMSVCIDALPCNAMSVDTSAAAVLHDGNYANGEQYVYTTSLAAGAHTYYFTASDGAANVNLPASGSLSGPTVSSLSISTSTLPDGTVGAAYSQTLAVTGGTAPYTFSATSLPAGLSLNTSTGVISGTPTTVGLTGFSVSVTDATSVIFTSTLSINVVVAPVNTGDVTIVSSGSSSGGSWAGNTWTSNANGSTVLASEIMSHLTLGATVINSTVSGDIIINGAVSWSSNNTLTFNSVRDIKLNSNITATGNGAGLVLGFGAGRSYSLANWSSITLAGSTPILKIGEAGSEATYIVINSLGVAGDISGTTLQGINSNLAGRYALGSNIDATETSGWNAGAGFAPVGDGTTNFTGQFDGLGHAISNLIINRPTTDYVGLFGFTSGSSIVRNMGLIGGSVSGNNIVGVLVSWNSGTITNTYSTGTVSGLYNVGGLVGINSNKVRNAYATGSVSVRGGVSNRSIGGLVGENRGDVSNAYATGSVSGGIGSIGVGGLVGHSYAGSISNSFATGKVIGAVDYGGNVGGLVGSNEAIISNAYATGSVSAGAGPVGGLVGGNSSYGTVNTSYSTGNVSGNYSSPVGGLVGYNPGNVSNSFWDTQTTCATPPCNTGIGAGTTTGATGLTSAQMMSQVSFTGFDFNNIWYMIESKTRPFLSRVNNISGLVGYWKFDDAANLGYDSSGFSNNGSVTTSDVT